MDFEYFEKQTRNKNVVIGLDGFIDEIIHVVDKREDFAHFSRIKTMPELADRIRSAAGKSTNIELVSTLTKIGGNGPIMANAMNKLGTKTTYIGNLGFPEIHPVFQSMKENCTIYTLAEPAHTDALEFEDGKIMFGKMSMLKDITWEKLISTVGLEKLRQLFNDANLVAMGNWTMVTFMSDIWESIIENICPTLDENENRYIFFDLSDPEKRTTEDKQRMLSLIPQFSSKFKVILGLNEREARQIAEIIFQISNFKFQISNNHQSPITNNQPNPNRQILKNEIRTADDERRTTPALSEVEGNNELRTTNYEPSDLCHIIYDALKIHCVVVHPIEYAVAKVDGKLYYQDGPTTKTPVITTGGGDHFNAGFCLGMISGLGHQAALLMGVCTSGYYVMTGTSPDIYALYKITQSWEKNKKVELEYL